MSGRYVELYKLGNKLYKDGSPVIIEAGALQKDTSNDKVLAQVKIKNVSRKTIVASKVEIKAYEISGKEIDGVIEFAYMDLAISTGGNFGAKTAIYLPNNTTRKFEPVVKEVVFKDGSIWTANESAWQPMPDYKSLENGLGDNELAKQFRLIQGENCKFYPFKWCGLVYCTCGSIYLDSDGECFFCKNHYASLLEKLDKNYLTDQLNKRLKAEAEQEEELREKKEIATKRLKKKAMIIVPCVATILALLIAVYYFVISPKILLEKANVAFANGNRQEVEEYLSSLPQNTKKSFYQSNIEAVVKDVHDSIVKDDKTTIDYWTNIISVYELDISDYKNDYFSEGLSALKEGDAECAGRFFEFISIDDDYINTNIELLMNSFDDISNDNPRMLSSFVELFGNRISDENKEKHKNEIFAKGLHFLTVYGGTSYADACFSLLDIDRELVSNNSNLIIETIKLACENEKVQPDDIVDRFSEFIDNKDELYKTIVDYYLDKREFGKALSALSKIQESDYKSSTENKIFNAAVEDAKSKTNLDEVVVVFSKITNEKSTQYLAAVKLIIAIQNEQINATEIDSFDKIESGNELLSEMEYRKLREAKAALSSLQGAWYGDPYYIYVSGSNAWMGDYSGCFGLRLVYNTGQNYWEAFMYSTSFAKFKNGKWDDGVSWRNYGEINVSQLPSTFNKVIE